jgi:FO synthase
VNAALQAIGRARSGQRLGTDALALCGVDAVPDLLDAATELTEGGFGHLVTYSPKVFIPLTQLCRDVCHYCTFATTPSRLKSPYLTAEDVLAIARAGQQAGCREALFTLGDKPELRYRAACAQLAEMGFGTTVAYLQHMAERVLEETGLLPHLNPGVMTRDDVARLRPHRASMGLMSSRFPDGFAGRADLTMVHRQTAAARLATIKPPGRKPFLTTEPDRYRRNAG